MDTNGKRARGLARGAGDKNNLLLSQIVGHVGRSKLTLKMSPVCQHSLVNSGR